MAPNDDKDELRLIVEGIRHAAEAIRTAVIGWHLRPGFYADGTALCAELYACAGRYESRLRDYAAVEAANVSVIRAVSSGQDGSTDDLSTTESLIAVPQAGTYILGADVAPGGRLDLLAQALGIVEGVIARLDADDSHRLAHAESWSLLQLRERIRDFAEAAARG